MSAPTTSTPESPPILSSANGLRTDKVFIGTVVSMLLLLVVLAVGIAALLCCHRGRQHRVRDWYRRRRVARWSLWEADRPSPSALIGRPDESGVSTPDSVLKKDSA
ncbi:hypothetical protein P152DRAFT_475775 [Eremomyces bilateralis CBS 781.70]|uniref:Uncharacterized protein n=1 Tax=Eremomyces bilateralis CBS 781.70 TaxID=1392243 RepID=A0A6G1FWQ7_9PEZI|nr:uncharacterized protein P152DRAFT_475775 [Eremomyces bilateralis CBS 781.70]KAF1810204.1 hypothetical protein P152DRAFT_475775 [Eremomyces bilateralis CBS 781.70]